MIINLDSNIVCNIYIFFIYSVDYPSIDTSTQRTYPGDITSKTIVTIEGKSGTTKGEILSSSSKDDILHSKTPASSWKPTYQDVSIQNRPSSTDISTMGRDTSSFTYKKTSSYKSKSTEETSPVYQSGVTEDAFVQGHLKLVIFLASIPSSILGLLFIGFFIKCLSQKFQWRLLQRGGRGGRRMRRRRSRERARIVRDAGMMQITSVINEGNLEGIELQEW